MPGTRAGALRVIVTRPERDAKPWVEQLRQYGFDALALPLIDIAPLPLQAASGAFEKFDAFMFVSGNAVDCFFGGRPFVSSPVQRFMAPGPGTAAALRMRGIPEDQIDAPPDNAVQFDSEALWQVVGSRPFAGQRVLIVRGANSADAAASGSSEGAGREWLAQQFLEAGADVQFASVYERRAPQLAGPQLELVRQAANSAVWIFSSSEAVLNLHGASGISGSDWTQARAIATHPRIAETLRAAGWGVVVESRTALADIVATLRSIESGYS